MENTYGVMKSNLAWFYSDDVQSEEGVASVVGILEAIGAHEYTVKVTGDYVQEADRILTGLPLGRSAAQDFGRILHFITERNF